MSQDFFIRCRCGEDSEQYNNVQEQLAECVRKSYPLYLVSQAGWGLRDVEAPCGYQLPGIPTFLARHWPHGGFSIVSEYYRADRTDGLYQPVPVVPDDADVFNRVSLGAALEEAKDMVVHLTRLIGDRQWAPRGF